MQYHNASVARHARSPLSYIINNDEKTNNDDDDKLMMMKRVDSLLVIFRKIFFIWMYYVVVETKNWAWDAFVHKFHCCIRIAECFSWACTIRKKMISWYENDLTFWVVCPKPTTCSCWSFVPSFFFTWTLCYKALKLVFWLLCTISTT